MAVETIYSTGAANELTANPRVRNTTGKSAGAGSVRTTAASITPSASQSSTSKNILFRVPSNAIPKHLYVWCADDTGGKWAFGLLAANGVDVVDDNHLGHIDFGEGPYQGYDALYRASDGTIAGTVSVADMEKPLWQTLGLTEDPGVEYWVYGRTFEDFDASPPEIHVQLEWVS